MRLISSLILLLALTVALPIYAADDRFDRPNSTNLGTAWNEYLTNVEIANNQVRNVDINSKEARFIQAIGPDQDTAVECKVVANGNSCGVMARWSTPNNFYYVRLDVGLGNIALFKKVNGVFTRLAVVNRPLRYDLFYRLRLVAQGPTLKVYFADEIKPAITLTDTSLSAGDYAGIRAYAAAAYTTYFDNFSASSVKPPINQPPIARMTATPQSGTAPLTVHFDGTTSSDADGVISSYLFDFGDGTNGAGPISDHIYHPVGIYKATLTISDNQGATGSAQSSINLTAPSASCIGRTRSPYVAFNTPTTATMGWECAPQGTIEWGVAPNYTNLLEDNHGGTSFQDDFGRADTTHLGGGWTEYLPDFGIVAGRVANLKAASQESKITIPLGPNQSIAADCMVKGAGNSCGVMARWSDANNYYYVRLDAGQQNIRLFKKVAGIFIPMGTISRPLSFGTFYRLRLVVQEGQIQAFFSNETTPAIAIGDVSLTQGDFAGIRSYASAPGMTFFDNFAAEENGSGDKHFVTLSNLSPSTRYSYRVSVNGGLLGQGTFKTAKASDNNFTFTVFGDSGTESSDQLALASLMKRLNFSFGLIAGDVIYPNGLDTDFDPNYFIPYLRIIDHIPFFPVVGNQDIGADGGATFKTNFVHPTGKLYYDFHWGDTHFIALNSNNPSDPEQLAWLNQILSDSAARWKIVYFHHPPYSSGEHGSDLTVQTHFVPLFEKYHVDVVFAGHDHDYERSRPINGVQYIVTGGGGAPITPAGTSGFTAFSKSTYHIVVATMTSTTLTLRAVDKNGALFDSVILEKPGVATTWTATPIIDGLHLYSHPKPFELDNGEILAGFSTNEETAAAQYKLVRSTDGGATFPIASKTLIAAEPGNSIFEGAFAQLNDPNKTLVSIYGAGTDVRMKRSIDRGATWGPATTLVTGTFNDPHPDVKLLSNGDLYLVYSGNGKIVGRRSSDGGQTWNGDIIISEQADILRDPSIAQAANGDLLGSFMNTGAFDGVQTSRSSNYGATWEPVSNVRGNVGAAGVNDANLLRLSNGQILLSYSVGSNTTGPSPALGDRGLYIIISNDNGLTWQNEALVYDGGDPHRGNFTQLANGLIIGACATIDGDTDYHVAKLIPPTNFPPALK